MNEEFPMDYTIRGILQARILEWVAVLFSRVSSQPGIEPRSPALQVDSSPSEPPGKPKLLIHATIKISLKVPLLNISQTTKQRIWLHLVLVAAHRLFCLHCSMHSILIVAYSIF